MIETNNQKTGWNNQNTQGKLRQDIYYWYFSKYYVSCTVTAIWSRSLLIHKSHSLLRDRLNNKKKTEKNYSLLNLNATSFLLFPSVSYPSINFEKTDLFGKEAQTTAGRYGCAGTRGTCHTTEPRSLHFRPQSHSASRPRDQKKDGVWGREWGVY